MCTRVAPVFPPLPSTNPNQPKGGQKNTEAHFPSVIRNCASAAPLSDHHYQPTEACNFPAFERCIVCPFSGSYHSSGAKQTATPAWAVPLDGPSPVEVSRGGGRADRLVFSWSEYALVQVMNLERAARHTFCTAED